MRGVRYYFNASECHRGHVGPRYAASGNCCECATKRRTAGKPASPNRGNWKQRARRARDAAEAAGQTTYAPDRPCKHGHRERWVSSNNCVQCDRQSRERAKQSQRNAYLKKKYGITADERDLLIEAQGGCAICGAELTGGADTHIDHCHVTGDVRGVLCGNCNRGIGCLGDDPDRIMKAAEYVATH
jgi:hypothetical protein